MSRCARSGNSAGTENVKHGAFILMLVLFCNCSTSLTALRRDKQAVSMATQREIDDVREAVFRYQFEHNGSSLQQRAAAYYLEIETSDRKRTDASDDFMKRFAANKPPVRKRSQARVAMDEFEKERKDQEILFLFQFSQDFHDFGVIDRRSGLQGLIFYQGSFKRMTETKIEISGGYYETGQSSSGNTYTVEKQNGKWTVTKKILHWVS
jgi:hypothetical protein